MKLIHAAVLMATAFLAACGGGTPEGDVRFLGDVPVNSKAKDLRAVQTFCPKCHDAMAIDQEGEKGVKNRCEKKTCKTKVVWANDYKCPSCQGSGRCGACTTMEQVKGDCYNCKGLGVLIYAGQSPNCPNCKGAKKCPLCKGEDKCDYCNGAGKIAKDEVKARAAKFLNRDEEEEPKKEEPKKEEPKKEENKEEKK